MYTRKGYTVKAYDNQLKNLTGTIIDMSGLVKEMIEVAHKAVFEPKADMVEFAKTTDKKINAINTHIDSQVITILALRQPMAEDLRFVIEAIKIALSLERMGDMCKNIIYRANEFEINIPEKQLSRISKMFALLIDMLDAVLETMESKDGDRALKIWKKDEKVNKIYHKFFDRTLEDLVSKPDEATGSTHILFTAKNLERMCDYVSDIAQSIYYIASGSRPTKEERDEILDAIKDENENTTA